MWLIVCTTILAVVIYLKVLKPHRYWKNRQILYIKPWPIIGNMLPVALQKRSIPEHAEYIYNTFPKERYFGMYQFLLPTLVIRDLELIKRVTVKDFETFPEHRTFVPEDADPLFSKNLISLPGGDRWHDMRSTLSPSFTSSKLRIMFGLMTNCATQFVQYFEKYDGMVTVEMKDAFSRFTNDVIATTAFGVTCDSLKNRDNEFYLMGKDATDFTGLKALRGFLYTISPTLTSLFKVRIMPKKVDTFFRKLIKETLAVRELNQIVRPDMIHLLMEARKGRLKHDDQSNAVDMGYAAVEESQLGRTPIRQKAEITDEDITAQALSFFIAGFDTVSISISFTAYELAVNPDIQENLRNEIDQVLEHLQENQVSYDALLAMKYMDLVITESLRKWPPTPFTDRKSVKPFVIEPELPWETSAHFEAGTLCWIPIYPIHRDPQYYPNPDKFDPERFNDENKHKIKPFSYLPFGAGPRSCIGSRFALLETKLLLFYILRKFEIVAVEKTPIPMVLSKNTLLPASEGGFWLGLNPRKKK